MTDGDSDSQMLKMLLELDFRNDIQSTIRRVNLKVDNILKVEREHLLAQGVEDQLGLREKSLN